MRAARQSKYCSTANYTELSHSCFAHWMTTVRLVLFLSTTQDELSQLVKTPQRRAESPPVFEHPMKLFNQSTELKLGIQLVGNKCFILMKCVGKTGSQFFGKMSFMSSVYYIMTLAIQFPATKKKNEEFASTGFQQF